MGQQTYRATYRVSHHSRMGRLTSPAGEYSLRGEKTMDIISLCLFPDQYDLFAQCRLALGPVRIKDNPA